MAMCVSVALAGARMRTRELRFGVSEIADRDQHSETGHTERAGRERGLTLIPAEDVEAGDWSRSVVTTGQETNSARSWEPVRPRPTPVAPAPSRRGLS
jgi:hypothetical protein